MKKIICLVIGLFVSAATATEISVGFYPRDVHFVESGGDVWVVGLNTPYQGHPASISFIKLADWLAGDSKAKTRQLPKSWNIQQLISYEGSLILSHLVPGKGESIDAAIYGDDGADILFVVDLKRLFDEKSQYWRRLLKQKDKYPHGAYALNSFQDHLWLTLCGLIMDDRSNVMYGPSGILQLSLSSDGHLKSERCFPLGRSFENPVAVTENDEGLLLVGNAMKSDGPQAWAAWFPNGDIESAPTTIEEFPHLRIDSVAMARDRSYFCQSPGGDKIPVMEISTGELTKTQPLETGLPESASCTNIAWVENRSPVPDLLISGYDYAMFLVHMDGKGESDPYGLAPTDIATGFTSRFADGKMLVIVTVLNQSTRKGKWWLSEVSDEGELIFKP